MSRCPLLRERKSWMTESCQGDGSCPRVSMQPDSLPTRPMSAFRATSSVPFGCAADGRTRNATLLQCDALQKVFACSPNIRLAFDWPLTGNWGRTSSRIDRHWCCGQRWNIGDLPERRQRVSWRLPDLPAEAADSGCHWLTWIGMITTVSEFVCWDLFCGWPAELWASLIPQNKFSLPGKYQAQTRFCLNSGNSDSKKYN
jgi:hypothetical protein